jgi:HD superfamily phosphohydrolase
MRAARRPTRSPVAALEGVVPDRVLFSPWLRRLGRISFLGALDRAPGCRARPTRLDHVLGAAALALAAGRALALEDDALRLLSTAALLHDVGHFPLSHTAEPAFKARFGLDHHDLTKCIVLGGGPIEPSESLSSALRAGGVDPRRAWSVIDGDGSTESALLLGAVNVDTLDGIPRAARAFGKAGLAMRRVFGGVDGRLFVRRDAVAAVDRFWSLKNRVYRDVINAPAHAALELRLSSLVGARVTDAALQDLLAFDDAALLAMLGLDESDLAPDADELASEYVAAAPGAGVAPVRVLRSYEVDDRVAPPAGAPGLFLEDWPRRWRTSKHRWHLITSSRSAQLLLPGCWEVEGDLP